MTLWGRLARQTEPLPLETRALETPDGDFVELLRLPASSTAPRVLVLHGLEGTARSHYIGAVLSEVRRRGWGADVLLFRSCGAMPNRTARFYHSGDTGDAAHVLSELMREFPHADFVAAGFSLGGNVLLKWLGEMGDDVPPRLKAAAAVSVPFDLSRSVDRIGSGFSRLYEQLFLRSLMRKARAKARRFPGHEAFEHLDGIRTLRGFDDLVTARLHGFEDANDYYSRSSAIGWLRPITLPTLLLSAVDDPFLPPDVLDEVVEIASANSALVTEFIPHGGHVGFVGGRWPWQATYYAERRIADFFSEHVGTPQSEVNDPYAFTDMQGDNR